MGLKIADLNDNLEHQKSIETLLLDQRRAVSSVSIDEEVANLMRFQRFSSIFEFLAHSIKCLRL